MGMQLSSFSSKTYVNYVVLVQVRVELHPSAEQP